MFLGSEEIVKLIKEKDLVKDFGQSLEKQIQPNGIDLTLRKVESFSYCFDVIGTISVDGKTLPKTYELLPDKDGYYDLQQGQYLIYVNETVKLPKGLAAISIQRSTIMRCGSMTQVGSWDSSYEGRGCCVLFVGEKGIKIQKNARIVQMHFVPVSGQTFEYNGSYQKENLQ